MTTTFGVELTPLAKTEFKTWQRDATQSASACNVDGLWSRGWILQK